VLLMRLHLVSQPIDFLSGHVAGIDARFWIIAFLESLHLYPIMYLNVAAALSNVDPSLEDAARNLGARGFNVFRRITLPLMLPGFLAGAIIVFIWGFTDLGTPLMFSYDRVIAVRIYNSITSINSDPTGYMMALLVIVLTAGAFIVTRLFIRHGAFSGSVRSVAGTRETRLSKWGVCAAYITILVILAIALLPHIGVALTSIADPKSWNGTILPTKITMDHFREVFHNDLLVPSIRNSIFLSAGSTVIDLVLGIGIAYMIARRKFKGQMLLDALVMLPLALPGLVLAFGYIGCFSDVARALPSKGWMGMARAFLDPIHGNPMLLLMIAYGIRRLPYMVRAAHAGLSQSNVELEEASLNLGASPARTMARITIPLIITNIIAGSILCFAFAMLEVSDSLLLAFGQKYYPITKALWAVHSNVSTGDYVACAFGVLAMVMLLAALVSAGAMLGKRIGMLFRA
jgi:iron(III) transport system permease protein